MQPSERTLAVSLLIALSAAGCGGGGGAAAAGGRGPGGPPPGIPVRAAPVEARDVTYTVTALGSLEAEELVQVVAEVEGAVTEVSFREGDRVTPRTVIARIDPERYRLEAQRAEANYQKAVADAQRASADFERREALARDQLVAAEELNRSRAETDRLKAEAVAMKAARDIASQNLDRSEVRAPRAGVINTRTVDTGAFVRAGTPLATLVDTSRLRLRFKVSEAESLRARSGQSVSFRIAALAAQSFSGEVYHVGEIADPSTRQVEVLAVVRNPGPLKPGFFAEVLLPTESRKGAIVVPETAVQASERGFVAYVVEDGKARVRPVQIGMRTGDGGVEIVTGLKPGEQVIVQGSDRLAEGVPVSLAGATAEAPPPGSPAASAGPAAKPASQGGSR